jgi:predicted O-methyltransferase YrrM
MSNRTLGLDDALYAYLCDASLREPVVMQRLREVTATLPEAGMQISPEQGQLMALLARLIGVRCYVEVGVFTGYSSLAVALAVPEDARVIACDLSPQWTRIAQRCGRRPASRTRSSCASRRRRTAYARSRPRDGRTGRHDLHRRGQDRLRRLLRAVAEAPAPGGLLLVDNTLWGGAVCDPAKNDDDTLAIRRFNAGLHADERIDLSLLPIGDGLTLARKR